MCSFVFNAIDLVLTEAKCGTHVFVLELVRGAKGQNMQKLGRDLEAQVSHIWAGGMGRTDVSWDTTSGLGFAASVIGNKKRKETF